MQGSCGDAASSVGYFVKQAKLLSLSRLLWFRVLRVLFPAEEKLHVLGLG